MKELTQRQKQHVDFIENYIMRKGYPPTVREIGGALGIGSTNGVITNLRYIQIKGFLEIDEGVPRGIRVLKLSDGTPVRVALVKVTP